MRENVAAASYEPDAAFQWMCNVRLVQNIDDLADATTDLTDTFLASSQMLNMDASIGDTRNASCPSNPLQRQRGKVYVEPCSSLQSRCVSRLFLYHPPTTTGDHLRK